jgi:hypothetical protein
LGLGFLVSFKAYDALVNIYLIGAILYSYRVTLVIAKKTGVK